MIFKTLHHTTKIFFFVLGKAVSLLLFSRSRNFRTTIVIRQSKLVNFKNPIFASMARIMAFDYGTKRIGIAVTDPLQIIATGLDTIHPKDIIDFIKKYLLAEPVEAFVLGEPKQMDGTPSESYQHVKGFSTILKKNFPTIPQHWVDERFTSKMAHATIMQSGLKKTDRRDKERVDTISATIILQYFMEQNRL